MKDIDLSFKEFSRLDETNVTGGGVVGGTETQAGHNDPTHTFANCQVFDVDGERYQKCIKGKKKYDRFERYVGNDELGETIRQYGRKNPSKSIIIRDKNTGSMSFLRKGK